MTEYKLTKAQARWLAELRGSGFVEHGGWGCAQKNRPLNKLVSLGLAYTDYGPAGGFLKTYGYLPVGDYDTGINYKNSPTIMMAANFLSAT